jgi:hypothetical protein
LAITPPITRNFRKPGMVQKDLVVSSLATDDPSSTSVAATGIGANGENPPRRTANNQRRFMTNWG